MRRQHGAGGGARREQQPPERRRHVEVACREGPRAGVQGRVGERRQDRG